MMPITESTELKTYLILKEHCCKWKIDNWKVSSFLNSLKSESFVLPGINASLRMILTAGFNGMYCLSVYYDNSIYLEKCIVETSILIGIQNVRLTCNPLNNQSFNHGSNGKSVTHDISNGKSVVLIKYNFPSTYSTFNELAIICKIKYGLSTPEVFMPYSDKMIVNDFGKLFNDKKFCDVVLLAGNEKISAHVAVLAAVSPYFFAMFDNPSTTENKKGVVNFTNDKDVTADNLRGFLEYIYGGKSISELSDIVSDLLILADKFGVEQLRKTCECYISESINEENVVDILILSDKYRCELLKKKAVKFAKMHIDVVKASNRFNELLKIEDVIRNLL